MENTNLFNYKPVNENLLLLPENAISFDELFEHYVKTGFMYEEKIERIKPHFKLIRDNWEKAWKGGNSIFWTAVYKDLINNKKGTVTIWKTTNNSWFFQHLTSETSKAVLALIASVLDEGIQMNFQAGQNWFSPTNNFCRKLYSNDRIYENGNSQKSLLHYYKVDPAKLNSGSDRFKIREVVNNDDMNGLLKFTEKLRGPLYCQSENLYSKDINLEKLDMEYRKLNLGRKRYFWTASSTTDQEIKAVLIAYRGPFGFNFSFLENRCEIIMDSSVEDMERTALCSMLLSEAAKVYLKKDLHIEYPDNDLYVLVASDLTESIDILGGVKIREYMNGVWLRKDFYRWRDYFMNYFNKKRVRV